MRPALINAFRPNAQIPLEEVNPFIRSEIKKAKKPKPKKEVLEHKEHKSKGKEFGFKDSRKIRLWVKQKGVCAYCDIEFKTAKEATLDHINPKSKGGSKNITNLALVCYDCNQLKGNFSTLEEAIALSLQRMGFFTRLKERGFLQ